MDIASTKCLFLPGFFQIGYVSNDLDRAQRLLGEQFGIENFHQMLDLDFDEKTRICIATAYVGETMIEIITPTGTGEDIYSMHLPSNEDFVIRHHHYGHLYTREEDWLHVQSMIRKHPVVYHSEMEGLIEAVYIDTRSTLGHYLEYIYATPAGLEFLNQAPQNG